MRQRDGDTCHPHPPNRPVLRRQLPHPNPLRQRPPAPRFPSDGGPPGVPRTALPLRPLLHTSPHPSDGQLFPALCRPSTGLPRAALRAAAPLRRPLHASPYPSNGWLLAVPLRIPKLCLEEDNECFALVYFLCYNFIHQLKIWVTISSHFF